MEIVTINGQRDVPSNDDASLLKALAHQPVRVRTEAAGRDFQFYSGVSPFAHFRRGKRKFIFS